jgi:hypothetical protein
MRIEKIGDEATEHNTSMLWDERSIKRASLINKTTSHYKYMKRHWLFSLLLNEWALGKFTQVGSILHAPSFYMYQSISAVQILCPILLMEMNFNFLFHYAGLSKVAGSNPLLYILYLPQGTKIRICSQSQKQQTASD